MAYRGYGYRVVPSYNPGYASVGHVNGRVGLSGYQTIKLPNWVEMLAAQKNEARVLFGNTSKTMPGRSDIYYAHLSGDHASKLINYWTPQLKAIDEKVRSDYWFNQFTREKGWNIATRDAWNREYDRWKNVSALTSGLAKGYGSSKLPETITVSFWQALEPVVLRGSSIAGTPTQWEMMQEAIAEQALATSRWLPRFEIPAWMKWAGLAGLALYLLNMAQKTQKTRR